MGHKQWDPKDVQKSWALQQVQRNSQDGHGKIEGYGRKVSIKERGLEQLDYLM